MAPPRKRQRHNLNRAYHEPIGPATALISPTAFEAESTAALDRAQGPLAAFDALLGLSSARDEIALRCSVEDLYEDTTRLHENATCLSELTMWHADRLFPSGHGGKQLDDDDEEEEEEGAVDEAREDRKKRARNGGARNGQTDPQLAGLLESAQASTLQILKPIKDIELFLRKTRTPDYNTLTVPREAAPSRSALANTVSPLSSLIYSITMHSIPRITNRSPFPTRAQSLEVLGGTTLWEIKENLRAGGDSIPSVAESDGGEDVEMEGHHWGTRAARPTRWTNERRVAGAVWGVEGVLYGDHEDGKVDYAEMVAALVDSTAWASKRQSRHESTDIDVNGQSELDEGGPEAGDSAEVDGRPDWTVGGSMQQTLIGELELKVGEPYWFMHQGNCEHIWTVDKIRHVHPSDPVPLSTLSTAPYPITTFLSRGSDAKCRLCDRDPGSVVTLDDELAGETPALLCATCFEYLHGDNADQHVKVGTTFAAAFSPYANTVAVFPTPNDPSTPSGAPAKAKATRAVFLTHYDDKPLEAKTFRLKTYTIWASLQDIARKYDEAEEKRNGGYRPEALRPPPSEAQVAYYNRISGLYRDAIVAQLVVLEADGEVPPARKEALSMHYASLHSILSLSEILYVPASPAGGVVGEELLDWLNTVDRAPAVEEGEELVSLGSPWDSDNFWPYLYRCILRAHLRSASTLLTLLSTSHSSPTLRRLAEIPVRLIDSFPRSTAFKTEREFLVKSREWRRDAQDAQTEFAELAQEPGQDEDEDGLRGLLKILVGEEGAVLEHSEDWREAVAAWGVWVNSGLRRDDLPDVVKQVTRTLTVDATLTEEAVMASLLGGDVARALQQCNTISLWLVSHLSDLLDKVGALPSANPPPSATHAHAFALPPPSPEQSLRDYFILSYTDILLSDPGLWRIVLDYLSSCGAEGRARMRAVVLAVNLDSESKTEGAAVEDVEMDGGETKENEPPTKTTDTVEEVLRACAEHGLDDEMRKVCKIYAELLVTRKEYGTAVSFCIRAGDSKRIARIATRVLDEYVTTGQDAFIKHVDSIPTSLLRPPASNASSIMEDEDEEEYNERTHNHPYSSRLSFLARYRDFFALYARGERREAAVLLILLLTSGVAPKGFYAVMMLDVVPLLESPELLISLPETFELLRILEELTAPIIKSGKDLYGHLDSLSLVVGGPVVKGDAKEMKERTHKAMKQLDVVC
ncbi:hypothetical protein RQP46_008437 [Phenoliferia psychrophenolica]